MKKKVMIFFALLFLFVLALALLSNSQTGKISNISGYSVAAEDESYSGGTYGSILTGILIGLLFVYAIKFIFESYERKSKEISFKRNIELELS